MPSQGNPSREQLLEKSQNYYTSLYKSGENGAQIYNMPQDQNVMSDQVKTPQTTSTVLNQGPEHIT